LTEWQSAILPHPRYGADVTSDPAKEYDHLIAIDDFDLSLLQPGDNDGYEFTDDELDGVDEALGILDQAPADVPGQLPLHPLQRHNRPWWSITPPRPTGTNVRILVRPEPRGGGVWIVGAVTRHYKAPPSS
jgi:hypothetical protein